MQSGIPRERCNVALKPLCIDLFHGIGGWGEAALSAGFRVVGIDIVDMYAVTGRRRLDGIDLVLQDVLTVHGSQLKDASLLCCSPPCQKYSWLSMPWSRSKDPENSKAAKALRRDWEVNGPDNRLFDACFRIQAEAIEATAYNCPACFGGGKRGGDCGPYHCARCNGKGYLTRYIPMVVENVRGAQEWVGVRKVGVTRWLQLSRRERIELGRSKARFGSFHLFGDVGMVGNRIISNGVRFSGSQLHAPKRGGKNDGGSWFAIANNTESGHSKNPVTTRGNSNGGKTSWFERDDSGLNLRDQYAVSLAIENGTKVPGEIRDEKYRRGTKIGGDWFRDPACHSAHGSRSSARKIASAEVAKIPPVLAQYIAQSFYASVPAVLAMQIQRIAGHASSDGKA